MGRLAFGLAVLVLLISVGGAARAERLLLVEGETRALLMTPHLCGQPVIVVVESARPEIFEGDAAALQGLLDGVRAMLAYECPELREIELQGRLAGMPETLYRGVADRESGWRLNTLESIRAEADPGVEQTRPAESALAENRLAVAGLDAGMTYDEARSAVLQAFGGEPRYEEASGMMIFASGGCPAGYDPARDDVVPEAGWKCLRGWFSRDEPSRLLRFELVQVTEHESADEVAGLLEARFGPPRVRWFEVRDTGGLLGAERAVAYLAWGDVVSTTPLEAGGRPRPVYALEAAIDHTKGVAVTTLVRAASGAVPADDPPAAAGTADLKL